LKSQATGRRAAPQRLNPSWPSSPLDWPSSQFGSEATGSESSAVVAWESASSHSSVASCSDLPVMVPTSGGQTNPGSWGHPELCRRPCVYQLKSGACHLGAECNFCHCAHRKAEAKPDQRERQLMTRMSPGELVALLLPVFHKRAEDQGVLHVVEEFLRKAQQAAPAPPAEEAAVISRPRQIRLLRKTLSNLRLATIAQHLMLHLPGEMENEYECMRTELAAMDAASNSTTSSVMFCL